MYRRRRGTCDRWAAVRTAFHSLLAFVSLAAINAPSEAAVFGRNRMHLVSPRFEARLAPETRANLKRTLSVANGTGFLVGVHEGMGLVLTNEHVVRGMDWMVPVRFYSGSQALGAAHSRRVLSRSEELDYALIEIDLRDIPSRLVGTPAKLRRGPLRKGEQTYKVGFPALARLDQAGPYSGFDHTVFDDKREFARQPPRMVIATGHEVGGGEIRLFHDPDPRPGHRAKIPRYSVAIDDSSLPGNSGSPIFSAETHEVVAIHWAGGASRKASDPALRSGDRWDSANYAVPISLVLDHLREALASSAVPANARARVRALVSAE